jgi:hypothetical protein
LANVPQFDELIREVRGQKIMLDFDLAREWKNLKYQIGTSSSGHGGRSAFRPLISDCF